MYNKESPENACVQEQTMFWMVVWNIFYFPSYMGIIIIPSDFHIFQDD